MILSTGFHLRVHVNFQLGTGLSFTTSYHDLQSTQSTALTLNGGTIPSAALENRQDESDLMRIH